MEIFSKYIYIWMEIFSTAYSIVEIGKRIETT
jgi:hypothetical protein